MRLITALKTASCMRKSVADALGVSMQEIEFKVK